MTVGGSFSGFIFMCNGKTKPECYRNRVFGMPLAKEDVVKTVKKGTHLFLYDFDLKLLYGTYQATSDGALDLEPVALQGKFRAQVRFKISKDCLPLHESSFKTAIRDNYQGGKFKQELNNKQVRALISLFRPIASVSAAHHRDVVVPYPHYDKYDAEARIAHVQPLIEPRHDIKYPADLNYLTAAPEPYVPEEPLCSHDTYRSLTV
ncbi:B2 protein-like isoform X2 [Argentina anserina]|uniref:B2 protein-like isoform X2 n=1 Tax=Argentina anserina TaxID=57926 RepID=UPI002176921E|nr:B2 protein-like isoform X2 [Potentilla anserina]